MQRFPNARKDGLIVKSLSEETLVYDLDTDKAHCLNRTAAQVWSYCDGEHSVAEIAQSLAAETNATVPADVVWLALDQLQKFNLLEETPALPPQLTGINRRDVIRRIGIGALALPLIVSITAPPAHAQASNPTFNTCCNSPGDCLAPLTCKQSPTCIGTPAPSTKACIP